MYRFETYWQRFLTQLLLLIHAALVLILQLLDLVLHLLELRLFFSQQGHSFVELLLHRLERKAEKEGENGMDESVICRI